MSYASREGLAYGVPLVKFVLTYDGPLPSGNSGGIFVKKWEIRKQIHPQLKELWQTHRCLKHLLRYVPETSYGWLEFHHSVAGNFKEKAAEPQGIKYIDLRPPVVVGGVDFLPLVRSSYALLCGLKITFMRMEPVGAVYQGGDLDNRVKTFIDALKVPQTDGEQVAKMTSDVALLTGDAAGPMYCLLEDDGLVSGISVETARLLGSPTLPPNYVRLVAEVDVRVSEPHMYNSLFLGD
jgi:hypothetical protein